MKLGITAKLFLTLLTVGTLCAVATGAATLYSFNRGFLGYMNSLGVERLEALVPVVAEAYAEHGGWEFLEGNRRAWGRLLFSARVAPDDALEDGEPRGPTFSESDLTGVALRVALLDAAREYVAGNPEAAASEITRAVVVGGETVGWLALIPFQRVAGEARVQFQERQAAATWLIAGMTVLLAAGVALVLARTLLAPVRSIALATHRVASGDYAHRVVATSGDEIGRLAEDFNRLALSLQRNEQMRRAFMADVSHELRTPIAVLRAELEAIEDGVRPLDEQGIRDLKQSVAMLAKLVDDLHELSLSDVGALAYRKTDLDLLPVLRETLRSFEDRLAERRILVDLAVPAGPLVVHADGSRLRQLFANLLENTVRHADPGGRLKITCTPDEEVVSLDFEDSGPGVPESELPRIFERFYRGSADSGDGVGLGLAISRNIVEAHGGMIEAERSPLGGLKIAITLPRVSGR
ncbi:MAG TPA: ATP-binding protein [Woeseiaceae bacterium]|nr:ATP-binding protein [Woeseiaceae bacterium]